MTGRTTASVTVVRNDANDVQTRQMIVRLDGERIATLIFGDEVTHELEAGPHHLRISNTLFWKTIDFDVKLGERARFETINRAGRLSYPMLGFLGVAPLYLTIRRGA